MKICLDSIMDAFDYSYLVERLGDSARTLPVVIHNHTYTCPRFYYKIARPSLLFARKTAESEFRYLSMVENTISKE